MLIILNNKNSNILWNRLKWLYDLPNFLINNLKYNMIFKTLIDTKLKTDNQIFIQKNYIKIKSANSNII